MLNKTIALLLCLLAIAMPVLAQGSAVVAEIGGVQITRAELDAAYDAAYGDYAADDAQLAFDLRHELALRMLEEHAEMLMQQKMGFDAHTQQEIDEATARAGEEYESYVEYFALMLDDGAMTDDELHELAHAYLVSIDMSLEDYTQQAVSALADAKLRAWALEGVSAGEEEIRSAYETMLQDEQALYAAYPDSFLSTAYYGMPYLCVPEGVREIRQIVVRFDDDQTTEYAFLADAIAQGADVAADLDALYTQLSPRVTEILNQLDSGKPFADVEMEYSDDWILAEEGASGAYYVCAGAQLWAPAFTEAAMALTEPGQISGPVRMADGIHILFYNADLAAGPVPYEQVRDYVAESVVYQLESQAYAAALDSWMDQLGAHVYLDELY